MRQTVIAFAALAVGITALTGCGSSNESPTSTYCTEAKSTAGQDTSGDTASLVARAHKLAELAPAEIKTDWQAIATNADAQKDFAQRIQTNPNAVAAEMPKMQQQMEKMNASVQKIAKYTDEHCGK